MRLIDADALKDKCYITVNGTTIGRNNYVMFHEIDEAPTIDAVEVVRCEDCKYDSEDYPKDIFPDVTEETYSCERSTYSHDKDFYCKYGKRKE